MAQRKELSNQVRSQLRDLMNTLVYPVENPLVYPERLTDSILQQFKIRRVDFDIETTPDSDSDILFDPLPQSKLDRHRIKQRQAKAQDPTYMCVYPKVSEERAKEWAADDLATFVYSHLRKWVTYFPRYGLSDLEDYIGWDQIRIPNPYLLNSNGYDLRGPFEKSWHIRNKKEWGVYDSNVSVHPHQILWVPQRCVGQDGSLQYAEIASLLASMYARAFQRKIPADDLQPESEDEDGLHKFRGDPERAEKYPFAFEECSFPILMVSFLGTNARLLYAEMEADTLLIYQSKLYSFEDPDTAPWDLFARWVVSLPVEEAIPSSTVLPVVQGWQSAGNNAHVLQFIK